MTETKIWSVSDATQALGVVEITIRRWSKEFAHFLAEGANPEKGNKRLFTNADMEVFAYVAAAKKKNVPFDKIHEDLKEGLRLPVPDPMLVMTVQEAENTRSEIVKYQEEITQLRAEIVELSVKARLVDEYKQMLADANEQISKLNRLVGALQHRLGEGE